MKPFFFSKSWAVDWDLVLARKLSTLKEAVMFEKLKLITSGVWNFLRPLIAVFLSSVGPILAEAAAAAVRAQAGKSISNTAKRNNAYSMILVDLRSKGVEVGAQVTEAGVNAAIEAAVLGLKAARR